MEELEKLAEGYTNEEKSVMPKIYSPKLGKYVFLDSGNPKGKIQEYNLGMGPGSWY